MSRIHHVVRAHRDGVAAQRESEHGFLEVSTPELSAVWSVERECRVRVDGNDNSSKTTLNRIRRRAEQRNLVIYGVGPLSGEDAAKAKRAHHELDQLVERTGGVAYYPAAIGDIDAVALDVAYQIRNQYTVAYAPLNQALDGTYRAVRLTVAGGERLSIPTRAGYRATPKANDRP